MKLLPNPWHDPGREPLTESPALWVNPVFDSVVTGLGMTAGPWPRDHAVIEGPPVAPARHAEWRQPAAAFAAAAARTERTSTAL